MIPNGASQVKHKESLCCSPSNQRKEAIPLSCLHHHLATHITTNPLVNLSQINLPVILSLNTDPNECLEPDYIATDSRKSKRKEPEKEDMDVSDVDVEQPPQKRVNNNDKPVKPFKVPDTLADDWVPAVDELYPYGKLT
ncbi:hypothetical protein E1B28_003019 [Marasmius oreades]|uniref:Uncharacterized protein n=1 Tax=Marasmius oreades TaxID=181124 RepID=A0A9P7UJZ3_9AGAR|nr:uncharacterized protein E1B28_003019 [Marasmius oreades]KAG7085458.1 hypothetical protein E1B28_003019 [Marasmius oreades]